MFVLRALTLTALSLVSVMAFAQVTSNLTGRVNMDGNPLPGVKVTISSPNLQGRRTAITDVNGSYTLVALPPGDYTARFQMDSIQPLTRTVRLGLGQTGRVDAEVRLTSLAEAITVTASAPALLATAEIQTNFQHQLIDDLPLQRNLLAQANLAPNVNTNSPSGGQLVISGAPAHENLYMVNGAVINENLRGQIHSLFIEDAIQETTVLSGAISAEYGRFTGGVVNSITKSGGNEFTGSLRDSLTNPSWSAMSYDGQPDFTDKMNSVYEGTFGGRIIRDRLWFFTAGRYTENTSDHTLFGTDIAFQFVDEETRLEGKLTGQITSKHSLMASYLDVQRPQGPICFIACYEPSNVDESRELPHSFLTTHYSGTFTGNLLGELSWSKKKFAFEGSGGDDRSFAGGTWAHDWNTGAFFGAPVFCGTCGAEERNNDYLDVRLTFYFGSKVLGMHNVSVGYQDWAEERISNNYQSGSNFGMYTFSEQTPVGSENDVFRPVIAPGDFLIWYPITELSGGNEFATRSLYANDKWDLNNRWQFNLGLRYDRNDGEDAAGNKVADDSIISPRVGGIYDVFGNGRLRLNASYGQYVAKIAEGIGGAGAANGNPAYIFYRYRGPRISGLPSPQAFAAVEQWFNAAGGTSGVTPLSATFPGISSRVNGTLESPHVQEYTLGVGSQVGRGFVRADFITREWSDFYSSRLDASTGTVLDPLGGETDLRFIETSNEGLERDYKGVSLQASYPITDRMQFGGNYTWSETKGNVLAENSGSGPVAEGGLHYYPEYTGFARNNPSGFLLSDQTHKLRTWATIAIPTPIGNFVVSALQRFDSGAAYSAVGTVNYVTDPSLGYARPNNYAGAPTTVNYYFSDRGAFRWDDTHGTDLSVNYRLRLGGAELFIQPEIINIFNNDAVFIGNTTVLTADNDETLIPFNPFTETPREGLHYRFDDEFGQDRGTYSDFQIARTYRVSIGLRF